MRTREGEGSRARARTLKRKIIKLY